MPAAGRLVGVIGPGHRRMQTEERILGLDGEIRTPGDHGALVEESAPGIGAFEAFRADTRLRHILVAGRMGRLHGCDQIQLLETRNVGQSDDLGMFDAIAQLPAADGPVGGLEGIEHLMIGRIADGVNIDLVACLHGGLDLVLHLGLRHEQETVLVRLVRVGARSAAPRLPKAPSANSLTERTVSRSFP